MKKKLSINDIATQLGISITTVSFILNGRAQEKRISEKLVKRVQEFVQEVNYKPSSLARSLRTGKTNIIGLMVEDISDPFFSAIARAIEANAYQNGYKIIYCSTENDTDKTRELIAMYSERHVDGYIIVPPEGLDQDVKILIDAGKPVVLIDRYTPGVDTDCVIIQNEKSAYDATMHLINNGYKHIAFITIDSLQPQMQDRLVGYEKAMTEHQLPQYIKEIAYKSSEQAMHQISAFLDRKKEIDAIFFSTNYLCVSGLKAISGKGLSIPNDIGVLSFDDYELFELYSPSITTVSQPTEKIAEHAINLLLARLKKSSTDKKLQKIELPTTFIVRNSSPVKSR
ncbi:LacI family DNA-binding transcriptional regulator [Mucilaginibacter lacusdianchii]|uniref:LacI family DNA-binding transcriptional regulator n=1 Tax=Mucilaginibacter lacusdianchii TaxID=2684211 RepID=UPI00131A8578|nr:LacI family DNA-binding transcriptional regulator [Mucilaginibacter sp. JXJ CY 39]